MSFQASNAVESPSQRDKSTTPQRIRTSTACQVCRDKKVKCSGELPCHYCEHRKITCVFPTGQRRRPYSTSQVKALEQRLASYEGNEDGGARSCHRPPDHGDGHSTRSIIDIPASPINVFSPNEESRDVHMDQIPSDQTPSGQETISDKDLTGPNAIRTDLALSSSENFGLEVRGLQSSSTWHSGTVRYTSLLRAEDCYELRKRTSEQVSSIAVIYPSETRAYELLEIVVGYIGHTQHLFDPRTFSDRLSSFYAGPNSKERLQSLEVTQILLVFALGLHFEGKVEEESNLPGDRFFLVAMKQVPDLVILRCSGALGIEVIGLAALFLQSSDCKEDAHVYWGTALSLAKSQLMYRAPIFGRDETMLRSESLHRNRMWWTIYMQEKRIAAATGHPSSISDETIDLDLPTDAPGFSPAAPIVVNVRIAQITGRVMNTVYGSGQESYGLFITKIQKILSDLGDIAKAMPHELKVDFDQSILYVSRTSASLHLMLFQAIMLTLRPILLHLTKSRMKSTEKTPEDVGSPFKKLAATCITAAKRSLSLLQALLRQNALSTFGFFDLDAAFSVVFILLLGQIIEPSENFAVDIGQASGILRFMASNGNRVAAKRLDEVERMCSVLSLRTKNPEALAPGTAEESEFRSRRHSQELTSTGLHVHNSQEGSGIHGLEIQYQPTQPGSEVTPMDWFQVPDLDVFNLHPDELVTNSAGIQPTEPENNFYSLYHDPTVLLTGVDLADWGEFDRQIAGLLQM